MLNRKKKVYIAVISKYNKDEKGVTMDKKSVKKIITFYILLLILLIIPTVSAGFFSDFTNLITGRATTATSTANITLGNTAPTIENITKISAQSITLDSTTNVSFSFQAADADGVGDLDDSTATVAFNRTGEGLRLGACSFVADIGSLANYTCSALIYFFDGPGEWTVNVSIKDSNTRTLNISTNFSLLSTTGMEINVTALTFPSIAAGATNTTSDNDPIGVNNTANADITTIQVNAIDLMGEDTATDFMLADNFTANINTGGAPPAECQTDFLTNGTAKTVTSATITAGNLTAGAGYRNIFFCLFEVSLNATSQQSYSTAHPTAAVNKPWTISVS